MARLSPREGQHHPQSPVVRDRSCPQEDSPSPSAVGLAAPIVNVWAHHWGEGLDPPSDVRISSSPGWDLLSHLDRGSRDFGTHPDPRSTDGYPVSTCFPLSAEGRGPRPLQVIEGSGGPGPGGPGFSVSRVYNPVALQELHL